MTSKKTPARFGFDVIKIALREWVQTPAERIADIKAVMLEHIGTAHPTPHMKERIRYAPDLEALWYLRTDIWVALAQCHGELEATRRLDEISLLYGTSMQGMRSRDRALADRSSRARTPALPRDATDRMPLDAFTLSDSDFGATIPFVR